MGNSDVFKEPKRNLSGTISSAFTAVWGFVYAWLVAFEGKARLFSDLELIFYVIRRIILHIYNLLRSRVSYWYLFERTVARYPNNLALVFAKPNGSGTGDDAFTIERYTYQEFYDIVLRLSEILVHRYGINPDDTIGMDMTNKPLFLFTWFALWNIGATPAFLNFNNVGKPLTHCIKVAHMTQVLVGSDVALNVKQSEKEILEASPEVKVRYLNDDELLKEITNPNSIKFRQENTKRKANEYDFGTAALIYTSGTTGLPKPAIMSWRKAGLGSSLYGHIVKVDPTSTVFTSMPLYHSTASVLGVCSTFNQGGAIALSVKFSTSSIWTQIKLTEATHLQYVGEVCRYLLNSPIHPDEQNNKLRVAYGNGLRADIWREFKERFGIHAIGEFYAATESPIALTSYQEGDYGIGACRSYGRLIQSILQFQQTILKMDPEDNSVEYRDPKTGLCKVASIDEPGELIMNIFIAKRPETMFQGYLGNKKETESKILRDVFRKGDAWYRSGDLLRQDKDGLWYFVDRLGDTFRWKSENVSATEVENQLLLSHLINQVVVVGVKVPNHEGRAGFAVIELHQGAKEDDFLSIVLSHLELPRYAIPIFIKFVNEIPSSDNHKVPKKLFRNQVLPKGENGDDIIYWLKNNKYERLDEEDWALILQGKAKI